MNTKNDKLLVIIGPTGAGKTKLAVKLACIFNGEIVSADSRQVYRGMDVGTGKDLAEYGNVKYHCIDVVSPNTEFNLAKYLKFANKAIKDIQKRGKLPILTGGTGLYAQAIVDGYDLSGVAPDRELRKKLENMSVEELQKKLKKLDPDFTDELKNKRYLIRYIELATKTKTKLKKLLVAKGSGYDSLVLGIKFPRDIINKRIDKRLIERIEKEKMIEEVERLHKKGVSWKRLESFGLEYKFISQYLQKKLEYDEMIEKLKIASHQFAKRQMSWYQRWEKQGRKIFWTNKYIEANKLVKNWLR